MLPVVAAVVARNQGDAALAVRDEEAGVLVGVGRGVVRIRTLLVRAGGRREDEETGAAVRVVRADRLEIRRPVLRRRGPVLEELLQPEYQPRRHAIDLLCRIGLDPF